VRADLLVIKISDPDAFTKMKAARSNLPVPALVLIKALFHWSICLRPRPDYAAAATDPLLQTVPGRAPDPMRDVLTAFLHHAV
jgi:hypothetical protein